MALYAIGDIHGHKKPLKALIKAISPGDDDTLVFLGDYVSKGPKVKGVLNYLIKLARRDNFIFLRGNHDHLFIESFKDHHLLPELEEAFEGEFLTSYEEGEIADLIDQVPNEHIDFLTNRCQDFYETEDFIFVHGGIRKGKKPKKESPKKLYNRKLESAKPHKSGRTVICGHTAQSTGKIADLGHTICIDTGITKKKFLTCLKLDDFSYLQATKKGVIHSGQLRP